MIERSRPFALLCCATLALFVAGCNQTPDDPKTSNDATVSGPDAKPGIVASDGRLVLPIVAGRPGAVYFTVRNEGGDAVTIGGVDVTGAAKAEMHQSNGGSMSRVTSLPLDPGASMVFAPGGLHVMAFDLAPSLTAGGKSELTLTFADGDKLSMPLKVETIAQSDGDDQTGATDQPMDHAGDHRGMAGMNH